MLDGHRALLALGLMVLVPTVFAQRADRHVAMLSIDGLRPADYLGPTPCGTDLPALAELMRSGVYARAVTGVLPTVTYPAHATLVTGTQPSTHGVLNNVRHSDGAAWHFDRADIKVATLWDAAREAGLSVAIVTWPSTYGAAVDYLIPENLSSAPDVTSLVRRGSTPGLFESLETATGPVALLPFADPDAGAPLDRMTARWSAEIVRRYAPSLLLAHFLDLDHREHFDGIGSASACRALRATDAAIDEIRSAYRDAGLLAQTDFFIVSDHGFATVHTEIDAVALLRNAGWSVVGPESIEAALVVQSAAGSAAIYLAEGADPALAERLEAALRPQIETRFRNLVSWLTPEAAAAMGGFPGAAFVLCASPGYFFTATPGTAATLLSISERLKGTHGYCPDEPDMAAALIASGPGIRALGEIPAIRMVDIAPTVAALLGIELAGAEGLAIAGILARRP